MPNELEKYGVKKVGRLKDFRCPAPFRDFMVFDKSTSVCCPEWYDIDKLMEDFPDDFDNKEPDFAWQVSKLKGTKVLENWNNPFHKKLRETIGKGDYKYCSLMCPWLNKINSASQIDLENEFYKGDRSQNKNHTLEYYEKHLAHLTLPENVYFNFDTSCNLKCPSCRVDMRTNKMNIGNEKILDAIDNQMGEGIKNITITGSGDPFYSNIFRKWLSTPKEDKYPNLQEIFIVSNGNMFTPKIWEACKPSHKYINGMEWSIDAGTKETYENKTRLNGRWDKLMENMDFLKSIKFPKRKAGGWGGGGLTFSFVMQTDNYKEIPIFRDLINSKFAGSHEKISIVYRAIQDWGHQSKEWMKNANICDPTHPKHDKFLEEFYKVSGDHNVISNVFHLLDEDKAKISYNNLI